MRRQIEHDKRLLACEEAVYLRDAACSVTSTNESRETEARAWSLILDEVPIDSIVPGTQTAIKNKPNSYKPGARDVLAACRGEEWQTGADGKTERVVCANGSAYETWDEIKARNAHEAAHALPEPLPALDIDVEELKRRLGIRAGLEGGTSMSQIEKSDDPDVANYGAVAADIARVADVDLDACTPAQIADLRAFGGWWLTYHPRKDWDRASCALLWEKFVDWRAARREGVRADAR